MKLFGESLWAARSLSLFFGMLGALAIYFLSRELFNRKVAVYTVFIVSVSFRHILMSQEARGYAMFFLFSILSLYAFSLLLNRTKPRKIIYFFYVFFNVCLINIHYYAYPLVAAQGAYLLFFILSVKWKKKESSICFSFALDL